MVWTLLLAHFLGDYLLQPDWMVRNRTRPGVLALHIGIHLALLVVLFWTAVFQFLPYLLTLAGAHLVIDAAKNWLRIHRPIWVSGPYLVDQAFHYLSIVLVATWIHSGGSVPLLLSPALTIDALGFLLVTYVWYITERVLRAHSVEHPLQATPGAAARMLVRAGLLAAILMGWKMIAASPAALGTIFRLPYSTAREGRQAFLVDLCVTLVVAALVISARRMGG